MTHVTNQALPLLQFAAGLHSYPGFAYGHKQASISSVLKINKSINIAIPSRLEQLNQQIAENLKAPVPELNSSDDDNIMHSIWHWVQTIQIAAEHPVWGRPYTERSNKNIEPVFLFSFPCFHHESCTATLKLVINTFNLAFSTLEISPDFYEHHFLTKALELIEQIKRYHLKGFNPIHFLTAAFELNTPVIFLYRNVMQFGQGINARVMNSSFSEKTPVVGVQLARDKLACSHLLRMAGLPVAEHVMVRTLDSALLAAAQLGFPVVVKPADSDGGRGVSAHLRDELAVKDAYGKALEFSNNILVEKHIFGKDYRVHVVHGKVQTVLEREPGGVRGDGLSTVRQLIEKQNDERKHATDDRRYLHPIHIDHEVDTMLAEIGLNQQSIPSKDQFIRLRAASNVASGGIPVIVDKIKMHPDNCALVERATDILRLDIAGVDLLIPDISVSWLTSGAAICEVNAQPQMHTTMHKPTLQALLGERNGRIPCFIYLSSAPNKKTIQEIVDAMRPFGTGIGVATQDTGTLDELCLLKGHNSVFEHARGLLIDPHLRALLIVVDERDSGILKSGWPIDMCDYLFIDHSEPSLNRKKYLSFTNGIEVRQKLELTNEHANPIKQSVMQAMSNTLTAGHA
ncbi:ATP-binding protein [Undibacterium fentianense]|uniref:ATP-grasp domain-containing protein n=1 Tax=Undibacterium fentianense TaxID=2828728 RepID=A0A941IG93_9BURK|nr:ATP-grasp domain-containing protein [Undibacterium fentianense]MBR7799785.1 ATP-grasp domain-containing protein [Undibacterium fentianense]